MPAEIVFSDGVRVKVVMTDAEGLTRALNHARDRPRESAIANAAPGWARVETENQGIIYVNPAQVAFVREAPEPENVEYELRVEGA